VRLLALALFAALLSIAPHAGADGRFHPALALAVSHLDRARGPEAHAALREIWSSWDRAQPSQVEETLLAAENDRRLSEPVRAYAGWLAAHARTRRGDIAAAHQKIAALGFVEQWLIVGPFDNEGKRGLAAELGPEAELTEAIVPGRAYSGKERPVRWRVVPDVVKNGYLDFGSLLRPERKICAFATTFVHDKKNPKGTRTISAWVGATGAYALYWNGREVLRDEAYRSHDADRRAAVLTLAPGENRLMVKVCGDETPPGISVRLADAKGAPEQGLETSNDLGKSREAGALAAKEKKAKAAAGRQSLEGPLQTFERTVNGKAKAADLEAYARYLEITAGDDEAEHTARDLARRAAEAEPTIPRLLLAGELAEDRNQRAEWVKKAESLAKKSGRPDIDVLLARAELVASGASWQEASRYFDEALAIDPDDVRALHGRVSLYNTAGLKRSALATLERALDRNPSSVSLLNMLASQLRALGRTAEAQEVESRYSALRFDDQTFLGEQIDLSLARRDRAATERWVDRLLALDPDNQWALGTAARAYRALGQASRAVATYQRALTLAPEDVGTLRTLADLEGELGHRDKQLELLQAILKIRPQDKAVREYVEHIEPAKPRPDEKYAWDSKQFLKLRHAPTHGQTQRVLRDLTVTTVFENGLSSKFRQIVFQPLNDAGAALARNYTFQYESDREVVQLRGARVFRGDGRVDEAIESGEGAADDPTISMYTSARNFYVQFPRLDPGDVVELRYRVDETTPRNEFADYFGEVVYFGSTDPVQNAEYVLITPKSRKFYIDVTQKDLSQEKKDIGDQSIYRFYAKTVPPIVPEPSMPPWPEVAGFVHVSTFHTWKDLGQWYWGLVKEQFDLDDETRKLAREVAKGKTTELDKVKAVYAWVVTNTRYVALEFGIYGYKPHRCVQTVSRGWGDCKDKATVIVTLLKELGIESTIVVLRTQLRGDFKSKIPSLAPFDHAIVYVPSLDLYLDGTAEYTGSNELPAMDAGGLALLVNKGDSKLVHLPELDPKKNVGRRTITAAVSANGDAKLDLAYETTGANASDWRRRYHAESTRRDRINSDLGREFPGFEIQAGNAGITASDLENLEQPVKLEVKGTARGFARKEGGSLSMAVTPSVRLTSTYASLSSRTQDVRIVSFSTVDDTFVIKLPAGKKLESAPPDAKGSSPFGSYSVEVEKTPAQVTVKSRVELRTGRVTPQQYPAFKKFCEDVDRALGGRLVVSP
jgi:tetratricopeptide (TPR) repeat protein/transglutaminase-like putative cysteine protease